MLDSFVLLEMLLSVVMELADCICAGIGCAGAAAERDVDYGDTQKYQADWGY